MKSEVFTFKHKDKGIQRVQRISLDSWTSLNFLSPKPSVQAFVKLCELYGNYIVVKYAKLFGRVVLFRLPEDVAVPCPIKDDEYGTVTDRLTCAAILLRRGIKDKNGEVVFLNDEAERIYKTLESSGALFTVKGERKYISVLPVSDSLGFLTESVKKAKIRANTSFFVMDPTDCSTVYDAVGTPLGLCVKGEEVISAPLFGREALLVDEAGNVVIRKVTLEEITVVIDETEYVNGVNAVLCDRPKWRRSPKGGTDIVVRDNKVISWRDGGSSLVPSGGFVVHVNCEVKHSGCVEVKYGKMKGISFGIQVGNSVIVNGQKTKGFISPFYSLRRLGEPVYPPTLYRLNGKKYRAPRMVLGSDENGSPVLVWFEGAGKFGYVDGKDSTGSTLEETADICEKLGIKNGIHLDGGGSAQILLEGQRMLRLSDRDPDSFEEQERAIARGLYLI